MYTILLWIQMIVHWWQKHIIQNLHTHTKSFFVRKLTFKTHTFTLMSHNSLRICITLFYCEFKWLHIDGKITLFKICTFLVKTNNFMRNCQWKTHTFTYFIHINCTYLKYETHWLRICLTWCHCKFKWFHINGKST